MYSYSDNHIDIVYNIATLKMFSATSPKIFLLHPIVTVALARSLRTMLGNVVYIQKILKWVTTAVVLSKTTSPIMHQGPVFPRPGWLVHVATVRDIE